MSQESDDYFLVQVTFPTVIDELCQRIDFCKGVRAGQDFMFLLPRHFVTKGEDNMLICLLSHGEGIIDYQKGQVFNNYFVCNSREGPSKFGLTYYLQIGDGTDNPWFGKRVKENDGYFTDSS